MPSSPSCAWDLPPGATTGRFTVEVPAGLCAAGDVLFGGWTIALAVDAAQCFTGLHVRDVSLQFLAPARAGDLLDVTATAVRNGATSSHLSVDASSGGRALFRAQLLAGSAPPAEPRSWWAMPSVPPPEGCPARTYRFDAPNSARDMMDVRLAAPEPVPGNGAGGRALLWARVLAPAGPAARLAVLSDHVPYLIVRSLPDVERATTMLASLRITGSPVGDWTLLEVDLGAADGEYCVGTVRAWTEGGHLVAMAEQVTRTRFR